MIRTIQEWRTDYLKLSELYAVFIHSDMTLEYFLERAEEIFAENRKNSARYKTLHAYRRGLKSFHLPTNFIKQTIRHEGMHARVARSITKDRGIALEVVYILEPLRLSGPFGDAMGVGPSIEFPNLDVILGNSKEEFIQFTDRMLNEHPEPSDVDRLLLH